MFDYRGLNDVLFLMLYIGAGLLVLEASLYLLFRPKNLFMHEVSTESLLTIDLPSGRKMRLVRPLRSSRVLRRWTAALLVAIVVYTLYTSNMGEIGREYLSQVLTVILVAFLVWRAETLQELESG